MKEVLKFDNFTIEIDAENLRFNEGNLDNYLTSEGGFIDYYGGALALAERHLQNKKNLLDKIFGERFVEAKNEGGSDRVSEHKARTDKLVCDIEQEIVEAQYIVNRIKNHLKAWDRNHDNAQSFGHMLRKQLDKLHTDIFSAPITSSYSGSNRSTPYQKPTNASPPPPADEFGFASNFSLK